MAWRHGEPMCHLKAGKRDLYTFEEWAFARDGGVTESSASYRAAAAGPYGRTEC